MAIRAVLFDLFDTLVYFAPNAARREGIRLASAKAGLSEEAWIVCWRSTAEGATRGEIKTLEDRIRLSLMAAGIAKPKEDLVCTLAAARMLQTLDAPRLYPDVKKSLRFLRDQGFGLALLSNIFAYEREIIHQLGLSNFFDAMVLSCDVGLCKPEPDIYYMAAERVGVEPMECIFVGDGANQELSAARAVGMTAIRIDREQVYDDDPRDGDCDARVTNLAEFEEWLGGYVENQKSQIAL